MIRRAFIREVDGKAEVVGVIGDPVNPSFRVLSCWNTETEASVVLESCGWSRVQQLNNDFNVPKLLWSPPGLAPSLGPLPGVPTAYVPLHSLEFCYPAVISFSVGKGKAIRYDVLPEIVEIIDRRYGSVYGFTYSVEPDIRSGAMLGYGPVFDVISERVGFGIRSLGFWFRFEDARSAAYQYFNNLLRRDEDGSFYEALRAHVHRGALSNASAGG